MSPHNPISVTIITKNESKNIRRCLESVKWADEIIVLDSGSTDNTLEICKEFTPHVFSTDWPGFGVQKQRALEKATCEWVLSIDADEEVTPALKTEILNVVSKETDVAGFKIPRQSMYCGKILHYGGWGDQVLRLFKKNAARFTEDRVHESVVVSGHMACLKNCITHYSHATVEEVLDKINLYTTLGAEKDFQRGRRSGIFKAILKAQWKFIHTYFLRRGFLDGQFGFLMAVTSAHAAFYKNVKLMVKRNCS